MLTSISLTLLLLCVVFIGKGYRKLAWLCVSGCALVAVVSWLIVLHFHI